MSRGLLAPRPDQQCVRLIKEDVGLVEAVGPKHGLNLTKTKPPRKGTDEKAAA
jgi:hypothetical protein